MLRKSEIGDNVILYFVMNLKLNSELYKYFILCLSIDSSRVKTITRASDSLSLLCLTCLLAVRFFTMITDDSALHRSIKAAFLSEKLDVVHVLLLPLTAVY